MAVSRTAIASAPHMPKKLWSFAVLDAANKGNFTAITKFGALQNIPLGQIKANYPQENVGNPIHLLPWGKKVKWLAKSISKKR